MIKHTCQVGQVNLEPPEATRAKTTTVSELKKTTTQVRTHVVQVDRDGVDTPSEVTTVRIIEDFLNKDVNARLGVKFEGDGMDEPHVRILE